MPKPRRVRIDKSIPKVLQRRFLESGDKHGSAARKVRMRKVKSLGQDYRTDLRALLGKDGVREYTALKKRLGSASRTVRRREVEALLCRVGFNRQRAQRFRDVHAESVSKAFDDWRPPFPIRNRLPPRCSQWVDYAAPFPGEVVYRYVDKAGGVGNPSITSYLDRATGGIGSRFHCGVDDAGDDDMLNVDYQTAFRTFHTALSTGPLELNLEFDIRALSLTGNVTDEWGYSSAHHRQTVYAYVRVMTVVQPDVYLEQTIANQQGQQFGDDATWSGGGNPGETRTFRFIANTSYPQGTIVILEAGVRNESWFEVNDMGIRMDTDAGLVLNRLRVRSCP